MRAGSGLGLVAYYEGGGCCLRARRGAARRLEDGSFNLNLSYIDARLIAMGMPTDSLIQKMTRNPAAEVARFLETRHRLALYRCGPLGLVATRLRLPCEGFGGASRQSSLLLAAHASGCCSGHYRIYNLCVESYAHYNPAQVVRA